MDIIIDKNLQKLRSERGNTQEELATFLAVSSQAVSKWERGESIPDVAMLPRIAAYYNVSVDDLLGVGEIRKQERIEEYYAKSNKLRNKGLIKEDIKLWREAQSEFPNDLGVLRALMFVLSFASEQPDEIIALGERILRESTDNSERESAIKTLCFTYDSMGNKEKAKKYAYMGGSMWSSSSALLSGILEGDELQEHNLNQLLDFLDMTGLALDGLCRGQDYERYLWLNEFYLKIAELYFDDGFFGYYACRMWNRHLRLARLYLRCRNDEQKANEHLKAAAKFAKQYDDLSGEYTYTSTLLSGLKYNMDNVSKNYAKTDSELLLNEIHDTHFDPVRDKDWFKEVEAEIRANIGK